MTINARVALLTGFIPPYRLPLYQELAKRISNFRVFLSTPMEANRQWSINWADLDVHLQKTVTIQSSWRHPSGFHDPIYLHIPYDTFTQLNNFRPDVIISCELGARSLQAAWYCGLHGKCRLILWELLSEHTEQGRGVLRKLIRNWLLARSNAVLVNGESGARYVSRFGVPETNIIRVGQASHSEIFSAVPLRRSTSLVIRLLSVGQLIERKGLQPFLHLLSEWARAHPHRIIEYKLAGDGPLHDVLANQPTPSNLRIQLLGHIDYVDMPSVYSKSDILAFPTLADEWGLVVNEAMAAGLPVLGSLYSQAVEELVQDGINGWTFHPDHLEEAGHAIDRALTTNSEDLMNMCLAARTRASEITTMTMANQFIRAIKLVNE